MNELLKFLIEYCSELYLKYCFKFVDSNASDSFGNTYLVLASNDVKVRFIKDRGQLFLDFQSKYQKKKNKWYSLEVIRKLITKENKYFSLLDENNGNFLKNNISNILDLFSQERIRDTETILAKLERERSRYLFKRKR